MATRTPPQFPSQQNPVRGGGSSGDRISVGLSISAEMADRDANRFLVGLVVMAIVFALLLPVAVLMYIDIKHMKETIRAEAKDLRKLKREIREEFKQAREQPK